MRTALLKTRSVIHSLWLMAKLSTIQSLNRMTDRLETKRIEIERSRYVKTAIHKPESCELCNGRGTVTAIRRGSTSMQTIACPACMTSD